MRPQIALPLSESGGRHENTEVLCQHEFNESLALAYMSAVTRSVYGGVPMENNGTAGSPPTNRFSIDSKRLTYALCRQTVIAFSRAFLYFTCIVAWSGVLAEEEPARMV